MIYFLRTAPSWEMLCQIFDLEDMINHMLTVAVFVIFILKLK